MNKPVERVVLLVLDGFPYHLVSAELTPNLWALGRAGAIAKNGARCDIPATTYPGHATLITGRLPKSHKIYSGLAAHPEAGKVPGWAGQSQVAVPTLVDICNEAGIKSIAVLGDQYLFPVLFPQLATEQWPLGGKVAKDIALDPFGYPTNEVTLPELLPYFADSSNRFIFAHLNESDTAGHMYGPENTEAQEVYRAADAAVGQLIAALQPDWESTVFVVVSDHNMVSLKGSTVVNLNEIATLRALVGGIVQEAGCALLELKAGVKLSQLEAVLKTIPAVDSWYQAEDNLLMLGAAPNYLFYAHLLPQVGGFHGGQATANNLLVVGGGHPVVASLAQALEQAAPHIVDIAPTLARLLNIALPDSEGRSFAPTPD